MLGYVFCATLEKLTKPTHYNQFANEIRLNRSNNATNLATLASAAAFGAMPKTAKELKGVRHNKKVSRFTNQLSRLQFRLNRYNKGSKQRAIRELARMTRVRAETTFITATLVIDGFYNWAVIAKAAYNAFDSEGCK